MPLNSLLRRLKPSVGVPSQTRVRASLRPVGRIRSRDLRPWIECLEDRTVAAMLLEIAVTPANPIIVKGKTEQFIATGYYSDQTTQDLTNQVTWASIDKSVATVSDSAGSQGLAFGVGVGKSTISATIPDGVTGRTVTGSTNLSVTAAVLQSITVTPASPGIFLGKPEQFRATGTYSDASTKDLTNQVTWASADTSVATISNAAGSQGLASGAGLGKSTISATLPGGEPGQIVTGSTVLTVQASAPTITGERVLLIFKHNKKGKPIGQPLVDFVFQFSTSMNQDSTGKSANYLVAWATTKRVKKKTVTVFRPIAATASFDGVSKLMVTLRTTANRSKFVKGGEIIISVAPPTGVDSSAGLFLAGPTRFTILPKAGGIKPAA
jgi:hypothetical protein